MKSLENDILLICKGWYSEQYKNVLEAFNAYYHREYGFEDIIMDRRFALELFLKPTIIEMSKYSSSIVYNLFSPVCAEISKDYSTDFTNVMYDRCLSSIIKMPSKGIVDLSGYEEMLSQRWEEPSDCRISII